MHKVMIAGEALIDFLSEEYTENLESVERFSRHAGGSPENIASNLEDFGVFPLLISRIGDDPFGHFLLSNLQRRRIDTTNVQIDKRNATSLVFISKSKGNPTFHPVRGADHFIEYPDNFVQLLDDVDFFHISTWPLTRQPARDTVLKMIEKTTEKKIRICFDPNYRRILWEHNEDHLETLSKVFEKTFLCKPSDDDAFHIFGKKSSEGYLRTFHDYGVKNVILTLGKDGALVSDGQRVKEIEPLSTTIMDTTGAGDGFWSGVYMALLEGDDIFTAAEWGSAVAAYRLQSIGSDSPLPPLSVIKGKFLS